MPATTKSQYRLFSQVKGVQKWKNSGGKEGLSPDDLNPKYREEIEGMAKTIDPKEVDKMLSVDFDKLEESYDELDINEAESPAGIFGILQYRINKHTKIKPVEPYFQGAKRVALKSRGLTTLRSIRDYLDKNLKGFTVTPITKGDNYPSQESFRIITKGGKYYDVSMDVEAPGEFDITYSHLNENMAMATPGSVNGMGSVSMPGDPGTSAEFATQETGSGDLAATSALTDGSKKKKPKNEGEEIMKFLKFNTFVGEMKMHDRILPDVESIDENLGPDVKVGDIVVIQPPKGKTKSKGEVTFLEDDGKRNSRGFQTFYYKDRKGEEWAGSTLQIVSVNGKDNPDWGKT